MIRECPQSTLRTSTVDPLGGAAGGYESAHHQRLENVDDGAPGRCFQRFGSAHHQRKSHRCQAPWEVLPEGPEVPTINA
jgi:hypothetical protein